MVNILFGKGIMTARKILSLGLVADLQYADIDDGFNFNKTKKRYYRNGLSLLRKAMKEWKQRDISCVLQLGDVIDGFCKRTEEPTQALNRILDVFDEESWPVFHVVGNHELYNFTKDKLYASRLYKNLPQNNKAYFSKVVHPGLKICVLNTYEFSNLGEVDGTGQYRVTHEFLEQRNPNEDKNDPTGLEAEDGRFVRFNGGVTDLQMEWLKTELSESVNQTQNVIIIGHNPVYLPATDPICLCWNYSKVLEVFAQYSECIVCYLSGHDHDGGYAVDESGIHHLTMAGTIEHPESYAIGTLYDDRFIIEGRGDIKDFSCTLRYKVS